jgi:hypothetical protein
MNLRTWLAGEGTIWDWLFGKTADQQFDKFKDNIESINTRSGYFGIKPITTEQITGPKGGELLSQLEDVRQNKMAALQKREKMGFMQDVLLTPGPTSYALKGDIDIITTLLADAAKATTLMEKLAPKLAKDADARAKQPEMTYFQRAAGIVNDLSLGTFVNKGLSNISKPEVSYQGMNNDLKLVVLQLAETLRNQYGVKNAAGYTISDAYRKGSRGDHGKSNAIDIPGTALGSIKNNEAFYEEIFQAASAMGKLVRFEEATYGHLFNWDIIKKMEKKYKDVFVSSKGLDTDLAKNDPNAGAIHLKLQDLKDDGEKELADAVADRSKKTMSKWFKAASKEGPYQMQTVIPPAPPNVWEDLVSKTEASYTEYKKMITDTSASYEEALPTNLFKQMSDEYAKEGSGVMLGEALKSKIRNQAEQTIEILNAERDKVLASSIKPTNAQKIGLAANIAARKDIETGSVKQIARVDEKTKDAMRLRLSKAKFETTGTSVFDIKGAQFSMFEEQSNILAAKNKLSADHLNELASIMTKVQAKMREGLPMKEALEEIEKYRLGAFDATNQMKALDQITKTAFKDVKWGGIIEAIVAPAKMVGRTKETISDFESLYNLSGTIAKEMAKWVKSAEDSKKVTKELVGHLKPAMEAAMTMNDYVQNEQIVKDRAAYMESLPKQPSIARIQQYMGNAQSGVMNRSTYKSSLDAITTRLGEGEQLPFIESIKLGIKKATSEWKTFSEMFVDVGSKMVLDVTSSLENGFFDLFSGKLEGLKGLFRSVGTSVKEMIFKIISQMLAIQTMKFVLGVEIGANGIPSMSGGGIMSMFTGGAAGGGGGSGPLGFLGQIFGGGGNSSTGLGTNEALGASGLDAAGGSGGKGLLGSLFSGGGAMKSLSKLFAKGSGIGKFLGGAGGMALMGAAMFLTQPGRLFGGTKDHTGPAKEAMAGYTSETEALRARRLTDAQKYMYSGNMGGISNFNLQDARYYETKSGDGWFKGPKTTSGNVDPSGMISSQSAYFKLLMESSKNHYEKLHAIDKLREKSEYEALTEELKFKEEFLRQAQFQYDNAVSTKDLKKVDEMRGNLETAAEEVFQGKLSAAKAKLEEGFKAQEYAIFKKSGLGMNDMAFEKSMLDVQKQRLDSMEGTSAWYDANIEYLKASKSMADNLKSIAEESDKSIRSTKIGMIRGGAYGSFDAVGDLMNQSMVNQQIMTKGRLGGDIRGKQTGFENVISGYEAPTTMQWKKGDVINGVKMITDGMQTSQKAIWKTVATYQFKTNEEAIAYYEKENEKLQTELFGVNVSGERKYKTENMFSDSSKMNLDELSRRERAKNMIKDIPGADQEYFEALKEFYDQQFTVAEELKSMMSAGMVERSTLDIVALMNGTVEDFKNVFTSVQKQFREKNFSQSILGTAKGFESNADFSSIVTQISGMSGLKDQGYMVDLMKGMGVGASADPYTAWYNYALDTVKTKIRNAETGGDDMFAAYNDLFSLLSENADHLKQKADAVNQKMEDSLAAIEETLKVRLAEERKSLKGDVYFMDTTRYDIDPAMIADLRNKMKNNDPAASILLDEIRRKITGVSR